MADWYTGHGRDGYERILFTFESIDALRAGEYQKGFFSLPQLLRTISLMLRVSHIAMPRGDIVLAVGCRNFYQNASNLSPFQVSGKKFGGSPIRLQ